MTHCHDIDQQLARYLAGELTEGEAEAIERHAGECDRCAVRLEAATRLPMTMAGEVAPPPGIRARVLAAIKPAPRRPRWLVPSTIAAALVLGFALMQPQPKRAQPVTGSPAAIAATRAQGEFERLAVARGEVEAALRATPDDSELEAALRRLDDKRRQLEDLIREFET